MPDTMVETTKSGDDKLEGVGVDVRWGWGGVVWPTWVKRYFPAPPTF